MSDTTPGTPKLSWWRRLSSGLKRTSTSLGTAVADLVTKRKLDRAMLDDIEDVLLRADLGTAAAVRIADAVRGGRYDWVIDVQSNARTAMLTRTSAARVRAGWRSGEGEGFPAKGWTLQGGELAVTRGNLLGRSDPLRLELEVSEGLRDFTASYSVPLNARDLRLFVGGEVSEADVVTKPGSEFAVKNRDQVMGWAKMPAEQPGKGIRGQDFVTASGGTGWVLNPNTSHPQLSWDLLAFMNGKAARDAFETYQPTISARDDVPVPNNPFLTTTAKTLPDFPGMWHRMLGDGRAT